MLVAPRLIQFFEIDIDAEGIRIERAKFLDVCSNAAAHIKDTRAFETHAAANEIQASVLTKTPDVRRVPKAY